MATAPKGRTSSRNGFVVVEVLPLDAASGVQYWLDSRSGNDTFTHNLFRFPAKFHVPVVRWALEAYSEPGMTVLDPFSGSGTVQVEAVLRGRSAISMDVDPLATLITEVKSRPINPADLRACRDAVYRSLLRYMDSPRVEESTPGADISPEQFEEGAELVLIPNVPNLQHWFRRYVILDLARIHEQIRLARVTEQTSKFLWACFASVIRLVSNADPQPVSGLEVTTHQAELNKSRIINVYKAFFKKLDREIGGMEQFWKATRGREVASRVFNSNVLDADLTMCEQAPDIAPAVVITSPPYCRAVEYSRRHRLELFWLGFVDGAAAHTQLSHKYVGRSRVLARDYEGRVDFGIQELNSILDRIESRDSVALRSLQNYFESMRLAFGSVAKTLRAGAPAIYVVGDSTCSGERIKTADFLIDLASEHFYLEKRFAYAIRNHRMQYGLRNHDGIKLEHVLVLRRR